VSRHFMNIDLNLFFPVLLRVEQTAQATGGGGCEPANIWRSGECEGGGDAKCLERECF
jgi:hypothetical protein